MKIKSLLKSFLGFCFVSILALAAFNSCEVGLGAAVDTEAPVIDFAEDTVGSGAVIRDSFMVRGTWTDDGTIDYLKATLTNTSGKALSFEATGTVETQEEGKGTWNVVFDPLTSNIPDGSYELTLNIADKGKHVSKITRAIVIDNTAPIVVLTRPSTKSGATTFDSYGQKFTLEGKAADDNDVKLIEVNVYSDSSCTGTPLQVIQLPQVPLTIEQDVAEYSDKEINAYSFIYGKYNSETGLTDKTGGTVDRYCTLSIYDDSQRYPADGSAQTDEDKKGNVTHTYYVNDDEIATLFTEYKITELYHILNGSFGSASGRSITTSDVEQVLAQQAVTTSQFSINPENSPTFVVNSRSPLESGENLDEAKYQITSGFSTLQLEFSAGLDKHAIKKDTIGIYVRECDNVGNVSDSAPKIWLIKPVVNEEHPEYVDPDGHDSSKVEIVQSGTTYKFTTVDFLSPVNFQGLDTNKYYKIFVVGKDVMKNSILPKNNDIYAFNLKPDTQLINLSVTNIEPDYLSTKDEASDAGKTYKAKVTFSGGDASTYTVYRKFDNDEYESLGVKTSGFIDTFKTIDETEHPGETWAPSVITYQVKGDNDSVSSELPLSERQYDNTEPNVEVTEEGIPTVTDTQQATITLKGTASDADSGVKYVYVQIIDEANTNKKTPAYGETGAIKASYSGGEWLCQIRPSTYAGTNGAFEDEGNKRVVVTAVDGVGLTKTFTLDSTHKVNEKHFVYDSAVPKITLTNYQVYKNATTWENPDTLVNNDSLIVGKLFKINGTLTEEYGLADTDGFTITQKYTSTAQNATPVTKKISISGVTTPANAVAWNIQLPFKSDGTAYDNATITGNSHPADGTYEYTIKAKDKAGNDDNDGIKFSVVLNTKGPVVTVNTPEFTSNVTKYWQKTRDIMVAGKASSPATITGIYWTKDGTKTVGGTWSGWTKAEGTNNWNFTVSYDEDKADQKLYIAAIDELNNVTAKAEYTLKVDATNPSVSPKFFQLGTGAIQQAVGSIYVSGITANKKNLIVYGTYDASVSGPYTGTEYKPLEFKINKVAPAANKVTITYSDTDISSKTAEQMKNVSITGTTPGANTKSWKAVFDKSVLASGGFSVTARNAAGLSKENTDLNIVSDGNNPEFGSQITISKSSFDKTENGYDCYYVNNSAVTTIEGTASDSYLLSVDIKKEGATTPLATLNNNPFNWSFDVDMTGWSDGDAAIITITDKAGNTTVKKLKFTYDTTPPVAKHEWDKKNKDLYFRIGEANNELEELQEWNNTITALADQDKNVGGKYLNGTFGNSETIRIRGDFDDSGSGLSAIYYKVFDSEPTEAQINAFIASPETEKTGSAIAPSDVTQRVSYTDPSDNKKKFKDVHTSFSTLISDLRANNINYIAVVAVDKVGNIGLDYAEKSNYDGASSTKLYHAKVIKNSYYTLNIDTINVENTVDESVDTTGYVNPALTGCPDIIISGTANSGKNDNGSFPSVISDVYIELKVNGKVITTTETTNGKIVLETSGTYTSYNKHWTATIKPKVVFEGVNSGQYPVYAIVSDAAGNKQTFTVAQINIDKNEPTVKINNISDADKDTPAIDVNGTLTIEGTVTEKESFDSVKIEYKEVGTSNWNTLATKTDTTWSAELNTTSLSDTTSYDILVTAKDKAGNTGTNTTTIYVNQDSDRPVVKFTNLTRDGAGTQADPYKYFLKYGDKATLEGIVSDDDAETDKVVAVFKASYSPITSATATASGTTIITDSSGDFKFTPATANQGDGEKTVYFYIKDNKGKEFYTTYKSNPPVEADKLKRPKQQYKTDAKEDNNAALTYKSDSNAPKIKSVVLQAYDHATSTDASHKTGGEVALGSNCYVGGPSKRYVDLKVTTNDDNGIKGAVIILEQTGKTTKYYRSNTSVTESGVTSYTATGSVAATTTSADYSYTTARLDVSGYAEGEVKVTIKVYDQSGLYANQESMFVVDNTAPTLTIENFEDGDVVYGIKKNTVGGTISGATDVEAIYYAVTKDKVNNVAVESSSIDASDWILVSGQKISAKIIFGGTGADSATGQVGNSLREWLKTIYQKDEDYMLEHDDNLGVAIHFKAVDACGNTGYSKRTLEVVPNGDKPTITLTYPVDLTVNGTLTNPSLAGTIRVYGNAEVAEGNVAAVYVQIDTNYNGTSFNASEWETGFNSCISGKGTTYTVEKIGNSTLRGVKATGTLNWNLPINGNKEFNPTGTSRPMAIRIYGVGGSGKVSDYVEQVFTVDPNAPHIGGDGSVSSVMQLKLVQFSSTPTTGDTAAQAQAKIAKQMPYKSGAWVTGQWYIAASVYDDSGIRSITLDQNDGYDKIKIVDGALAQSAFTRRNQANYQQIIVKDNNCSAAINNVTGKKNFDIYIPLPTTEGCGSVNFTIEAVEVAENANSSTENIKISYDNTPPKLGTVGHENYNANAYNVRQDNGFYRIFGYATDTEAGSVVSDMKAVAFYFVRRGSANTRVYDPMWKDKPVVIQTGTSNTTGITYEYGMFWNTKTVGRVADLSKLTLTAKDDNIHAGGFVLIEGTIYTIREVSSDGLTITLKTEAPANITTAKFAYAMVIDNFDITESIDDRTKITDSTKYGYGYYGPKASNPTSADDGDLMQEKWASGKWEAWINSNNIPDGPIEIHYVALDNAQNFSVGIVGNLSYTDYKTKTTLDVSANGNKATATDGLISGFDYIYDANKKAYVSNNAPRIAGVKVGCDFDGNGTISDTEKTSKYVRLGNVLIGGEAQNKILDVASKFIASDDGTSNGGPVMVVKDKTSVELEIIGGNGNLYYQYNIDSSYKEHSAITSFTKNNTAMSFTRTTGEGLDEQYNYYVASTLPAITFENSTLVSAVSGTNKPLWFTVEIWDSTQETTEFTTSQYAELKLNLNVQVLDTVAPNTVINDLYWNSSSDNSVYNNKGLKGHVELKGDLGTSELGTTYGTTDDKVSGVVVFRGYAYDNKRLSKLEWAIVNAAGTTSLSPYTAANSLTYTTGATYASGTWTGSGTLGDTTPAAATKHYKFTVKTAPTDDSDLFNRYGTEAYLDEKGHKVYWELAIDTSAIHDTVAPDAKVYIRATDSANRTTVMTGNGSTGSAGAGVTDQEAIDKATKKPTYQVDIVPYITGVTTALKGKLKTSIVDAYTRTTLGHYIVRENETVTFEGYNLAGAEYVKTKGTGNTADTTVDLTGTNGNQLAISNVTASSPIMLKVGSIYTINNMNNNNAKGAFTGTISDTSSYSDLSNYAYNRMPNNKGNNILTDDVYFDVWQFVAKAGEPVSGELREPVVKINPVTGKMGFAFVSGPADFSMPDGHNTHDDDVTYTVFQHNYATFSNVSMCYDELGYSYAIVTGLDTYPNGNTNTFAGRFTFQTSRWGVSSTTDMNDNYNATNKIRLEAIGLPGDSKCYVKGRYPSSYTMTETRFYSPSIVATNHTSNGNTTTSVYLAYYDSVQNQIRFRYGSTVPGSKGNFNNFQDNTGLGNVQTNSNGDQRKYVFEANTNAFSLIAGADWQKYKTAAGTAGYTKKVDDNYFYDTGYGAAKYVAIDAITGTESSKDTIVAVWYDGKDCRYAYTTNPTSGNDNGTEGGWIGNKVIFTDGGEHCNIKVGPDGSVHIVANVDGALKYAYLSSPSASYNEETDAVTVDSYAITGEKITLDVGRKAVTTGTGNNATTTYYVVPYISYYLNSAKLPALATLVIPSSGTMNYKAQGTDASNNFTGNWEISIVPTEETLTDLAVDKINVALWKKTVGTGNNAVAGVITGCTDTVFKSYSQEWGRGDNGDNHYFSGNGTQNPAIGYAIITDSGTALSIAQKK